jgi:Transposase domain (DUF772)
LAPTAISRGCSDTVGYQGLSGTIEIACKLVAQPAPATRLMAGLHILKYSENLSDERLCEAYLENPYIQYFCGEEFFQHTLPFDRSSLTRWRQRTLEPVVQKNHPV